MPFCLRTGKPSPSSDRKLSMPLQYKGVWTAALPEKNCHQSTNANATETNWQRLRLSAHAFRRHSEDALLSSYPLTPLSPIFPEFWLYRLRLYARHLLSYYSLQKRQFPSFSVRWTLLTRSSSQFGSSLGRASGRPSLGRVDSNSIRSSSTSWRCRTLSLVVQWLIHQ